jgi:hypothetical protein
MGTTIELRLGNLSVDWGKNEFYTDHLSLFQEGDTRRLQLDRTDEDCDRGHSLARRLRDVVPRLNLLGYTLDAAREEYESLMERFTGEDREVLPFATFLNVLCAVDIGSVSAEYEDDHSFGEFFREEIGPRLGVEDLFENRSDAWDFAYTMENFHPWHVLSMLAQNNANLNIFVVWDYFRHLKAGWSTAEEFRPKLNPSDRFLLVTEGSSDSKVIRKALELLRPEISDFFYFIDMEEGYPFSGSGNLANFCRGLVKIGLQNKTIILFDNDVEGVSKQAVLAAVDRPSNLEVMRLPDVPELRNVKTVGPSGEVSDDINGRAASIEAYLDFEWNADRPAIVRWTNFVESQNAYQGALESKAFYVREFLGLRGGCAGYNTSKLESVLDSVVRFAGLIARSYPARSR